MIFTRERPSTPTSALPRPHVTPSSHRHHCHNAAYQGNRDRTVQDVVPSNPRHLGQQPEIVGPRQPPIFPSPLTWWQSLDVTSWSSPLPLSLHGPFFQLSNGRSLSQQPEIADLNPPTPFLYRLTWRPRFDVPSWPAPLPLSLPGPLSMGSWTSSFTTPPSGSGGTSNVQVDLIRLNIPGIVNTSNQSTVPSPGSTTTERRIEEVDSGTEISAVVPSGSVIKQIRDPVVRDNEVGMVLQRLDPLTIDDWRQGIE